MKSTIYKYFSLGILFTVFLGSCTEVIEIDLNSSNPVIVAEGYIQPDSVASIRLTYTTDYFNAEPAEVIDDARIVVTDQNGISETMKNKGNGIYTSEEMRGTIPGTYNLEIEVNDKTYSGYSGLLPHADIDSIFFTKLLLGNPEMSELLGYTLNVAMKDIPEMDVYYAFIVKQNGQDAANTYGLASTKVNQNGNFVYESQSFFVMPGDTLDIAVFSLDLDAYVYYSELNEALSGNLIMSPAPFNASSNLGEDIMGYFMARSRKDTTVIVPALIAE